jgi:hypothetical protein
MHARICEKFSAITPSAVTDELLFLTLYYVYSN